MRERPDCGVVEKVSAETKGGETRRKGETAVIIEIQAEKEKRTDSARRACGWEKKKEKLAVGKNLRRRETKVRGKRDRGYPAPGRGGGKEL